MYINYFMTLMCIVKTLNTFLTKRCIATYARARACVCVYSSTMKASSVCKMSDTCLRGTDQRCYVVSIIRCASAKFLHLSIRKCHISPPKTKLQ